MGPLASEPAEEDLPISYAVGIDVGSQSCSFCVLKPDKSIALKPTNIANAAPGFAMLLHQLEQFQVPPGQMLVGLEATSRYGENLYQLLLTHGYRLWRLAPGANAPVCQTTGVARQNG
jgi:hypothetical protein